MKIEDFLPFINIAGKVCLKLASNRNGEAKFEDFVLLVGEFGEVCGKLVQELDNLREITKKQQTALDLLEVRFENHTIKREHDRPLYR